MKYPCYGCEERRPGCHSECPKYLEIKAEKDKLAEATARMKAAQNDVKGFFKMSIETEKRRH